MSIQAVETRDVSTGKQLSISLRQDLTDKVNLWKGKVLIFVDVSTNK